MNWSPSQPNGWYPRLSPDGNAVTYGNAESFFSDFQSEIKFSLERTWAGHWLDNDRFLLFQEDYPGWKPFLVYRNEPGRAIPLPLPDPRLLDGCNFFAAADGHWAANTPNGSTIVDGVRYATPAHGVAVGGGYVLQGVTHADQWMLRRWRPGVEGPDLFIPLLGNAAKFTVNQQGWVGYGYSGPAFVVDPDGAQFDVTATPWRVESCPILVRGADEVWIWNGSYDPATGEPWAMGRPLSWALQDPSLVVLVRGVPSAELSVVYRDGEFIVAGCGARGELVVRSVSETTIPTTLVPRRAPTTTPFLFGGFFAFSDRPGYGNSFDYPQNCTVVVEPDASVRAAALLPVIVTGDCLSALTQAGRLDKVLALYIGPEGGPVVAEAEAAKLKTLWRSYTTLPVPPVVWYIADKERSLNWGGGLPPSVDILAPELYFESGVGMDRLRELLWRKISAWQDLLGAAKPWLPVIQAFDRSDKRTDMRAIAALQSEMIDKLSGTPARGVLFFAVNRPGGARDYPQVAAWHRAIFASLPPGLPPLPRGGAAVPPPSSGGTTVYPKVTITSYTPDSGAAPLRCRAVAAREAGSGQVDTYYWLFRQVGSTAWSVAATNPADDPDHTYVFGLGQWEIALQAKGPGGEARTGIRRVVTVSAPVVEPVPQPPTPQPPIGTPNYGQFFALMDQIDDYMRSYPRTRRPLTRGEVQHHAYAILVDGKSLEDRYRDIRLGAGEVDPPPTTPPPVVVQPDPVTPPPVTGAWQGPLRTSGRVMVTDAGIFRVRGCSAFSLPKMFVEGRGDAARAYMQWAARYFNTLRVMLAGKGWNDLSLDQALTGYEIVLREARAMGMYVEGTAITGSKDFPADTDWAPFVKAVDDLSAQYGCGFVEIANEYYHASQSDRIHDVNYLRSLGATLRTPWAVGAAPEDEPVEGKYSGAGGTFNTSHLDRGRDFWNQVRRVRELYAIYEATKRPVINNEPIGAAEQSIPGRRESNPTFFRALGVLNRLFEVGGIFHLDDGLLCNIPGPVQTACAEAYAQGALFTLRDDVFEYKNAGHAGSPVSRARAMDEGRLARAYSFVSGDWGYTVLLGLSGDAGVEWANGFTPQAVSLTDGGLQVIEVRR